MKIHLGKNSQELVGDGRIEKIGFTDETWLFTDMLVISAGIRPRDELALKSGLKTGERGGVYVNNKMETSDPAIHLLKMTRSPR